MKKSKKQAAVGFIFITVLLDVIGWGIIIPVIPNLIKELINGDISEAAKYGGWLTFAYAITQFIFAPVIGNLSDKYGRRPVLLISLFGFLSCLFYSQRKVVLNERPMQVPVSEDFKPSNLYPPNPF